MGIKRKNEIVKKSNVIIRSHWVISSIWEPRIVALLASKIHVEDSDFQTYRIHISELIAGTGKKEKYGGRDYDEIDAALKKIMQKTIEVRGDNPHQKIYYSLFSKCLIDEKEGYLEIRFDADLKPHFLELKERFTQYSFEEFMQLPSTYSQRLFEILSSWKNVKDGEITISMDELHHQLDTPPTQRKNFSEFRERVLEKAHLDITANPDASFDYEWQAVKQGRKVIAVRFIFEPGRIDKERKAREEEARKLQHNRNTALMKAAWECSKKMAIIPTSEQYKEQQAQKQEVCNVCRSQGMMKSLFPPECQRYGRVEIIV